MINSDVNVRQAPGDRGVLRVGGVVHDHRLLPRVRPRHADAGAPPVLGQGDQVEIGQEPVRIGADGQVVDGEERGSYKARALKR